MSWDDWDDLDDWDDWVCHKQEYKQLVYNKKYCWIDLKLTRFVTIAVV